jgi:multiple sugar transport system substrate-binding protein
MSLPTRRRILAASLAASLPTVPRMASATSGPVQRLVVAAFPMLDRGVHDAIPTWSAAHGGVKVEVISRQYDDHHTAMTTALSSSNGRHVPDVMALEAMYLGRFSQGEGLQDLSTAPYGAESLRGRFAPFAFEQARNRAGALVALPSDIGPGAMFYRTDVLDKAGLTIGQLTQSWESYVDAGVQLKARTGAFLLAHARYLKNIVLFSALPPGRSVYFDAGGRADVAGPVFQRAFELSLKVRRLKLDAIVETWRSDWAEHLRRGRLVTELTGAWMAAQLAQRIAPATAGLWRSSPLPEGSFASYGGSYFAIPRRADPARKALAWSFIQSLTLDREGQMRALRNLDAFPALLSAQDDPFFDEPVEFLGGQRARQQWRDAARRIPPRPLHRQNKFAEEVIDAELDNVLIYGKSIPRALADAQALLLHRASR